MRHLKSSIISLQAANTNRPRVSPVQHLLETDISRTSCLPLLPSAKQLLSHSVGAFDNPDCALVSYGVHGQA